MDSKILHGCGHSLHFSCFPHGPGICSICKVEIQDALTTLSETASHAIRNINVWVDQEDVQDREEEDEDDDADDGYNPNEHDEATILAKSPGTLRIILIWTEHSPSPPPKQCWLLREVHAVTENFFVKNNANCLRTRPTLF